MNFIKKNYKVLILLIITLFFFTVPINVFWDSAHYTSYVSIFEGILPWKSWDIVRGPIFPLVIHLSNVLFGKTTMGILITSFLFYLTFLLSIYIILKKVINVDNIKKKNILIAVIMLIFILDPIIYGYYHSLLTELVAITLSMLNCYFAWKWIDLETKNNKKSLIFLSIYFILITPISWHLKQPYLTITLFPLLISYILTIIKHRNKSNIIFKTTVVILSFFSLICSIITWNKFLESKNIDLNSDRNVLSSFGEQLITGLNNYEIEKENSYDYKYLNNKEKEKINKNNNLLVNIYTPNDKLIDQTLIKLNNGKISTKDSILFIGKQFFKHPLLVIESYTSNYLALIDIYPKTTENNVNYFVEKEFDFDFCHENCAIAFKSFTYGSNLSYLLDDAKNRVVNYEQVNDIPLVQKGIFRTLSYIAKYLFKIVFVILPILCVCVIFSLCKKKNKAYNNILEITLILAWYSLLHLIVHTVTGACIDRYASPAYATTVLAIIIYIYYLADKHLKNKLKTL